MTTIAANQKPEHSLLLTAFWSLLVLILSTLGAAGATLTVTNVKDSGAGSLRAAIEAANSNGEEDTINFDPTFFNVARTITLPAVRSSLLPMTKTATDGRADSSRSTDRERIS